MNYDASVDPSTLPLVERLSEWTEDAITHFVHHFKIECHYFPETCIRDFVSLDDNYFPDSDHTTWLEYLEQYVEERKAKKLEWREARLYATIKTTVHWPNRGCEDDRINEFFRNIFLLVDGCDVFSNACAKLDILEVIGDKLPPRFGLDGRTIISMREQIDTMHDLKAIVKNNSLTAITLKQKEIRKSNHTGNIEARPILAPATPIRLMQPIDNHTVIALANPCTVYSCVDEEIKNVVPVDVEQKDVIGYAGEHKQDEQLVEITNDEREEDVPRNNSDEIPQCPTQAIASASMHTVMSHLKVVEPIEEFITNQNMRENCNEKRLENVNGEAVEHSCIEPRNELSYKDQEKNQKTDSTNVARDEYEISRSDKENIANQVQLRMRRMNEKSNRGTFRNNCTGKDNCEHDTMRRPKTNFFKRLLAIMTGRVWMVMNFKSNVLPPFDFKSQSTRHVSMMERIGMG